MFYVGIDPGASGAIAVIDAKGVCAATFRLSDTDRDVADFLGAWVGGVGLAMLERVHAMPKQGVSSTFKFGTSYGFCRGLLAMSGIRYEEVTPSKWQNALGCRSGGDKNVTKEAAQRMFPDTRVVHANADALLLAEYARRVAAERFPGKRVKAP